MHADEVLTAVRLPLTRRNEFVHEFKQAHRREDDIAIVNAGMRVLLQPSDQGWVVEEAAISYGGVAPRTISAPATQAALVGKTWGPELLQHALQTVRQDVVIDANAPGGMVEFRRSLASSFLFKFFLRVSQQLESDPPTWPADWTSAAQVYHRPAPCGLQIYDREHPESIVGTPARHMAADLQVTGVAKYTDDVPLPPDALHAAVIKSERAHARIVSVDASAALAVEGVAGVFLAKDVPGSNRFKVAVPDEVVYAEDTVTCVNMVRRVLLCVVVFLLHRQHTLSQPIGVVVADTEAIARAAAKLVKVTYEDLPAIFTIQEAIEAGSFFAEYGGGSKTLARGDVDAAMATCAMVVEGSMRLGGQEHFYLEPQCAVILPVEDDEFVSIASTQVV